MKEHIQVKEFYCTLASSLDDVNEFLKEIGTRVIKVYPMYDTILGGITYSVTYWC